MSHRLRQALRDLVRAEERRRPPAAGGDPLLLVAYPNDYTVGMSNLGLHAVLELALDSGAAVDRAFLPDRRALAEHRRSRTPLLSLEEERPAAEFDALLFSVSFEPDYVGVVQLLELAGIPPLAAERDAGAPLVIAGGVAPTLNPEPLAPIADLLGIGEAEALLPPLLALLRERLPRAETLHRAGALPGWYAPALGPRPVVRQHAPLGRPCAPVMIAPSAVFAAHVDVEVSRGCRWRCRFCAAGHVVTPYRELGPEALAETLDWGVARRGRVGLVGTDLSDHSQLEGIAEAVWQRGGELALPSLRVESLRRRTGAAARLLRARPPRSLTMAVEAATESLRCGLGKRLTDAHVLGAARNAAEAGVRQLRIYLLLGAPGERPAEVDAIAALARELLAVGPPGGLVLSVNGLVPKPGTPLQWEPPPARALLRHARDRLRRLLPRGPVSLEIESPDWTRWQALLSLGGREVAAYLLQAARDGWRPTLARAERESDVLRGGGRWPDGPLPWAHVDHGIPEVTLRVERLRCLAREYTPPTLVGRPLIARP